MTRPGRAALLLAGVLVASFSFADERRTFGLEGQFSLGLTLHDQPPEKLIFGLRYIPTFTLKHDLGPNLSFDVEASVNMTATARGSGLSDLQTDGRLRPYRLWARLATKQFEARLGLQKINFGSAMLLRPMMWFDRIDPNDPLQLTDGVYGLLLKYTFLNNTNIWLWGLLGNGDVKGWESIPTRRGAPEFGGRIQIPVPAGELAVSYHHRRMDTARSLVALPPAERSEPPEDRLGVDGKWDLGVGVWVEAVLARQDFSLVPGRYQKWLNVGADYTFGAGNGLHLLAEHLVLDVSEKTFTSGTRRNLTALTADYPLGLLDRLRAVVFRDWTSGDWYRLLTWQRTYDKWSFYIIGFWNPDRYQIYASSREGPVFAGKGFQITVVFNH